MNARLRHVVLPWLLAGAAAVFPLAAQAIVGPAHEDEAFASHLVMVLNRGGGWAGFCTGVVVAPRAVLTAAHCLASVENLRIFYRDEAGRPVMREVARTAINPLYRADAVARRVVSIDLALIETREPLDGRFSPAPLADGGAIAPGAALHIYGYGVAREGQGASGGVLRDAPLTARPPRSSVLLWAEDPDHRGAGACTGDSGGPIVADESGKVAAITAWSAGARRGSHCGALTQGALIAPQRAWIDAILRRWASP